MTLPLADKFCLVTGASHGIGKATALAFAAAGGNVALTYYGSPEGAVEVAQAIEELGRKAFIIHANLLKADECRSVAEKAIEEFGHIDVLVNNSGGGQYSHLPLIDLPLEKWEQGLNFNLLAPFVISQIIAKKMIEDRRGGSIVSISSIHSKRACYDTAAYGVAKAGLNRLTMSMALEWAQHGIRANAIAPGYINTSETPEEQARYDAGDNRDRTLIVAGRTGRPTEISDLCLFLASDAASYITGQTIFVDGGLLLPAVTSAGLMQPASRVIEAMQ